MKGTPEQTFEFACPSCKRPLSWESVDRACCPFDEINFQKESGIWRFLLPEREGYYRQFIEEYQFVRISEGRGSDDPRFYRLLPFRDISSRYSADWRIRARSYQFLITHLIKPLEASTRRPLKVLDLGAGNCWLSNRLASRGHQLAAVDLLTNAQDGLGACGYYETAFTPVQAEFASLPFVENQIDLAIFNASLHYAQNYSTVLKEALRVLSDEGLVIIMDTPVYQDPKSGIAMVNEREEHFLAKYGFPSNALSSQNFLTYRQLEWLGGHLGLDWEYHEPFYGIRWAIRPWKARLRGNREPARFLIISGRRKRP